MAQVGAVSRGKTPRVRPPQLAALITINVRCDLTIIVGRASTERPGRAVFRFVLGARGGTPSPGPASSGGWLSLQAPAGGSALANHHSPIALPQGRQNRRLHAYGPVSGWHEGPCSQVSEARRA